MVYTDSHAFAMLGTPPEMGRLPSHADDEPGAPPVVLLGHAFWSQQLASDPAIVGKLLRINGKAYSVIGSCRLSSAFRRRTGPAATSGSCAVRTTSRCLTRASRCCSRLD
jgi:hypothetical protein